ncbi:hypothetical protein BROUX41_005371 [Berkeleyomyces rouxiae]|uniref:uncharacterized protein n=1 Tax=Berkeleyomyces rouxiae TaxID=2035830 RepID=UPI003B7FCA11
MTKPRVAFTEAARQLAQTRARPGESRQERLRRIQEAFYNDEIPFIYAATLTPPFHNPWDPYTNARVTATVESKVIPCSVSSTMSPHPLPQMSSEATALGPNSEQQLSSLRAPQTSQPFDGNQMKQSRTQSPDNAVCPSSSGRSKSHGMEFTPSTNPIHNTRPRRTIRRISMTPSKRCYTADALLEDELASSPDRYNSPTSSIRNRSSPVIIAGHSTSVRAAKSPSAFPRSPYPGPESSEDELATAEITAFAVKIPGKYPMQASKHHGSPARAPHHVLEANPNRRSRSSTKEALSGEKLPKLPRNMEHARPDTDSHGTLLAKKSHSSQRTISITNYRTRRDSPGSSDEDETELNTQQENSFIFQQRIRKQTPEFKLVDTDMSSPPNMRQHSTDPENNEEHGATIPYNKVKLECSSSKISLDFPQDIIESLPEVEEDVLMSDALSDCNSQKSLEQDEMVVIDVDAIELHVEDTTISPSGPKTCVKEEPVDENFHNDAEAHILASDIADEQMVYNTSVKVSLLSHARGLMSLSNFVQDIETSSKPAEETAQTQQPEKPTQHIDDIRQPVTKETEHEAGLGLAIPTESVSSESIPNLEELGARQLKVSANNATSSNAREPTCSEALTPISSKPTSPSISIPGADSVEVRRSPDNFEASFKEPVKAGLEDSIQDITIDVESCHGMDDIISSPLAEPPTSLPEPRSQRKRKRPDSGQSSPDNVPSMSFRSKSALAVSSRTSQGYQEQIVNPQYQVTMILGDVDGPKPSSSLAFPTYSWPENTTSLAPANQHEKTAWTSEMAIRSSPRTTPLRKRVKRGSFGQSECLAINDTLLESPAHASEFAASQNEVPDLHPMNSEAFEVSVIEETILPESSATSKAGLISHKEPNEEKPVRQNVADNTTNNSKLSVRTSTIPNDVMERVGLSTPHKVPGDVNIVTSSPSEISHTPRVKGYTITTEIPPEPDVQGCIVNCASAPDVVINKTPEADSKSRRSPQVPLSCQSKPAAINSQPSSPIASCPAEPQPSSPQPPSLDSGQIVSVSLPQVPENDPVHNQVAVTPERPTTPSHRYKIPSSARSTPSNILSPSTLNKKIELKEANETNIYDFPDSPETNACSLILKHTHRTRTQRRSQPSFRAMMPIRGGTIQSRVSWQANATSSTTPETPAPAARTRILDTHVSAAAIPDSEGEERHHFVGETSPWMDEPSSVNFGFGSQHESLIPRIPGPSQLPTDDSTPTHLAKNPWAMHRNIVSATPPRWNNSTPTGNQPTAARDSTATSTPNPAGSGRGVRPSTARMGNKTPSRTASPFSNRTHIMDLLPGARSSRVDAAQPGDDFVCRSFASFMSQTPRSDRKTLVNSSGGILKNRHTASQTPTQMLRRARKRVTWSPSLGSTTIFTVAAGRCRKRQASPPPQLSVEDNNEDEEPTPALLTKHLDAVKKRGPSKSRLLPSASQQVPGSQPVDAMALTFLLAENDVVPGSQADTESYSDIFRSSAEVQDDPPDNQMEADKTSEEKPASAVTTTSSFAVEDGAEDIAMAEVEPDADDVDYVMDNLEDFLGMSFSVEDEIKKQAQLAA